MKNKILRLMANIVEAIVWFAILFAVFIMYWILYVSIVFCIYKINGG